MSCNILNLPEYQVLDNKRVTIWVFRRLYTCRACNTTFKRQLSQMVDGFHMTRRLNEYVKKRPFNHFHALQPARITLK
ncbi:hypothetical protein EDB94_2798 [Marinobacter sp. 3-2]|nr:hypothetical protein EDB94_2798 [Marinobacter sp. 3-2]